MAYALTAVLNMTLTDGSGGQQSIGHTLSTVVPTEPMFCATGSANTSFAAVAMGNVGTAKGFAIVNDGAVELSVSTDGGATTAFTLGITSSTAKINFCIFGNAGTTPQVKTLSSTATYRTFIFE